MPYDFLSVMHRVLILLTDIMFLPVVHFVRNSSTLIIVTIHLNKIYAIIELLC